MSLVIEERREAASSARIQSAALVAVAFVLRAIWLLRSGSKWAFAPDSDLYVTLARGMVHGCGFAPYVSICGPPEVFRTPGYPVFLIPFGADYRAVILAQAMIGAFVCWLVARFVTRSFGSTAGLIAAAFVAVDIPTILNTKQLMTEALFQAIATLAIFASLREKGILGGVMLGASVFVRPVALVLLPVVALAFAVKRNWRGGVASLAVASLMIGGWCARNYREAGVFTPSVEGEWNLYWYTAPAVLAHHNGTAFSSAQAQFGRDFQATVSAEHLGLPPDSSPVVNPWGVEMNAAMSRFLLSRSLAAIVRHPIDFAIITLEGFMRQAFAPYYLETGWRGLIENETVINWIRILTGVFDGALLLMLWAGAIRSLAQARRDPARWTLLCAAVMLLLAAAPYHGGFGRRYRSPAIPFLAVLAGIGWAPKRDAGPIPGQVSNRVQEVPI